MPNDEFDVMVSGFLREMEGKPNYARNLIGLAEMALEKKQKFRAFDLAQKVLALPCEDQVISLRARSLLASLLPGYHVPMMNDHRRNAAWDRALRNAIRPGMHVLEIGTGAGMLALMAARAGAAKVTTCEIDPIAAAIAREICERNGYGGIIEVIAKSSADLIPGVDIQRPADLLFCDIFSDTLIGFNPLPALMDARERLLCPGAPVVPAASVLNVALAEWKNSGTAVRASYSSGFDITPFANMVRPATTVPIGDPDLHLRSSGEEAFRFDFGAASHSTEGRVEIAVRAESDGIVDGILHWIRLELDSETVLEARPEPGAMFFSKPQFWALPQPREMSSGETLNVAVEYIGKRLFVYVID